MSRQQLLDDYCVRCNRQGPTPYLRDRVHVLVDDRDNLTVVDLGCGNGRNSKFIDETIDNVAEVKSFDMVDDYGQGIKLGKSKLPVPAKSVDIILANYLFMFLDDKERKQLVRQIKRIARPGCRIMVELYAAKQSHAKNDDELRMMRDELATDLGWKMINLRKERFIAENV